MVFGDVGRGRAIKNIKNLETLQAQHIKVIDTVDGLDEVAEALGAEEEIGLDLEYLTGQNEAGQFVGYDLPFPGVGFPPATTRGSLSYAPTGLCAVLWRGRYPEGP